MKVGSSDWAGVRETRGGAAWPGVAMNEFGLSEAVVLEEKLDVLVCIVTYEGRLCSEKPVGGALLVGLTAVVEAAATADDRGADIVFFILEKIEETRL